MILKLKNLCTSRCFAAHFGQLFKLALILIFIGLPQFACVRKGEDEMSLAKVEAEGGRFQSALSYFERAMAKLKGSDSGLAVAIEAARISFYELKDYPKAIEYNEYIVTHSQLKEERIEAQKQLVNIYANHLSDHKKAIREMHKLNDHLTDTSERLKYRLLLAKSYFYLNDFYQAESEVDEFLRQNLPGEYRYDLLKMKANIANAQKKPDRAAVILSQMRDEFPEKSQKEELGLTLAIALEEAGQYPKALEELNRLKATSTSPEQYEIRIQRLKERTLNAPGRRGRRK